MTNVDTTRLAVLIDADNSSASVTTELLAEIAEYVGDAPGSSQLWVRLT